MGQLITTVVGGVAGFMIGGPFGAQVGMMLGGMIGATLFGPTIHGPRLNDLKVAASTYGVAIPEIYGTVRIGGNLIWTTGIKETKKKSGGKGGPKQETYYYDATFAMGLCKGEIDDVLRIWADGKLIYDNTAGASRTPIKPGMPFFMTLVITMFSGKKKKNIKMRLYRGTEDQLPDSLIVADKGADSVSAHRGLAYVVFERLQLEDFGNRIPQLTFEVTKTSTRTLLALPAKDPSLDVSNAADRDFLPDFETGRVLAFDKFGGITRAYAADTMTEIGQTTTMAFNPTTHSCSLIHGDNKLLVANYPTGVGFSCYNIATLSQTSQYNTCSGLNNQFDPATKAITLSTTGRIGHGRFVSGEASGLHIVHTDWQGKTFLMDDSGRLLNQFQAPFAPHVFLEGRRNGASSQIIGWRYGNDQLEMFVINTPGSAAYATVSEGGSETWIPYTGYTTSTVNLKPYPSEKFQPVAVLYDPTDDHIFCIGVNPARYSSLFTILAGGGVIVFKYSLATGTYKFLKKHDTLQISRTMVQNMRASRLSGDTFGWVGKPFIGFPATAQIDLQTGVVRSYVQANDDFGISIGIVDDQFWDDGTNSLMVSRTTANGLKTFNRLILSDTVTQMTVGSIVSDVCLRSGVLTPDDIDLTELNDGYLVGYSIDRLCTARDALKQLATAFLFDAYESDYKLKFRSRGGDSVTDIPEDWVVRQSDDGIMKETLTQELEMPLRISINYYDVARDHQQNTQSAKRKSNPFPTMWTRKEDVVELPVSWDADSAKRSADKLLKMAWANRMGHQFSLPWRYLKYDPTDVITVTRETGTVYNLRLTEANIGADFTIEAKAVSEVATAYVSDATGVTADAPPQYVSGGGSAYPMVINTPLLRDMDYDTTGMATCYVSAGTNETSFSSTAIYMDNGLDYQAVGVINGQTTSGYTVSALPATTSYESTDEETVLVVRLSDPSMELESVTQDDMLNFDANAALVGQEVIQFRDATLLETGEWSLSGILRARRGTNYAVRGHTVGERFLLIDANSVAKFSRPPESYVTTRSFKAAPLSTSLSDVVPITESLVPRDLMPYTPEAVKISDNGTDVTVKAERRSRVTSSLRDGLGTVHYKEGDMMSARMVFKVWVGKTLSDVGTGSNPDTTITKMLFDATGTDLPAEAAFPVTLLGAADTVLIQIVEIGEVDGIPKWVEAKRFGQNRWNLTELY